MDLLVRNMFAKQKPKGGSEKKKKKLGKVKNPYGYVIHHLKHKNHFPAIRKRKSPSAPSILRNTAMNSFDIFSSIRFDYTDMSFSGGGERERKVINLADFEKQDKVQHFKPSEQDIQQRMAELRAREKRAKMEASMRSFWMRMSLGGEDLDDFNDQLALEEDEDDFDVNPLPV
eukprot:TRINITY_DN3273_c0_g1_i1.p1 TRINITY_DN3273_c0_g1~~TRINITY_DN3273_c0_g1_i1.p1  ORF type:complete len:173 (-),score=39.32 TRINITY_DN3273_c0_g1_i1:43-561(-)